MYRNKILIVTDTYNHRIQKFSSNGTYITQWGTYGTGNGQFRRPHGVAVNSSGFVFVTDFDNHRVLNNMKVEGTQLVVYVGGNGDVTGYYANWREYEPYLEYPVTSPQEAFTNLKNNGVPVGMSDSDAPVSIDDVHLAYQTTAGAHGEDYLKPVWVFKGNVMVGGRSVMPVEQYIPALTDEAVKSLSS